MKIRIFPELVFACVSSAISYRITSAVDNKIYRRFEQLDDALWLERSLEFELDQVEFFTIKNEIELVKFTIDDKFYWTSFFQKIL